MMGPQKLDYSTPVANRRRSRAAIASLALCLTALPLALVFVWVLLMAAVPDGGEWYGAAGPAFYVAIGSLVAIEVATVSLGIIGLRPFTQWRGRGVAIAGIVGAII
jgi:hypothetical protein